MPDQNCIFCRIIRNEIPSQKVYEDDTVVIFRDIQPAAPVHFLAVPKEHYAGIHDVPSDRMEVMAHLFGAIRKVVVERNLAAAGYRVVINAGPDAGQAVPHLHAHVLSGRPMAWPPG